MANSAWADEAFGQVDKSTWASRVAEARSLRTVREQHPDRVVHEDNGFVWGPTGKLLDLAQTAQRLDFLADHPTTTNEGARLILRECAAAIRDALGVATS